MKRKMWNALLLMPGIFLAIAMIFVACSDDDDGGDDPQGPELTITSFNPTTAKIGETVVITGTGFNADFSQNSVFFTGSQTSATPGLAQAILEEGNATSLTVIVPENAINGPITVRANSTEAVSSQPFTLDTSLLDPVLTSLDPTNGLPGVAVTITGENFGEEAAVLQVLFGDTEATISAVTNTSISTSVPENLAEGELQVSVSRNGINAANTLSFTVNPLPVDVKTAYWTTMDGILRGEITDTGVNITTLYDADSEGFTTATGVAVDFTGQMIYFTSSTSGVNRAPLGGEGPIELLYEAVNSADLAIEPKSGKIYFFSIDEGAEKSFIFKGDMDGSGDLDTLYSFDYTLSFETFLYEGPEPYTPKLLLTENRIYWTETGINPRVMVGSITGDVAPQVLFSSDELIRPTGIAIDPVNQKLYIADNGASEGLESTIFSGNLDGSGTLSVLVASGDNVRSPSDMEIDSENGFVYWLNEITENTMTNTELTRASLDGETVEVLFDGFSGAIFFDLEIGVVDEIVQ